MAESMSEDPLRRLNRALKAATQAAENTDGQPTSVAGCLGAIVTFLFSPVPLMVLVGIIAAMARDDAAAPWLLTWMLPKKGWLIPHDHWWETLPLRIITRVPILLFVAVAAGLSIYTLVQMARRRTPDPRRTQMRIGGLFQQGFIWGVPAAGALCAPWLLDGNAAIEGLIFMPAFGRRGSLFLALVAVCFVVETARLVLVMLVSTLRYMVFVGWSRRKRQRAAAAQAKSEGNVYKERGIASLTTCEWGRAPDGSLTPPRPRLQSRAPSPDPFFDAWMSVQGYAANITRREQAGRQVYVFDYHDCLDAYLVWPNTRWATLLETDPLDFSVAACLEKQVFPSLLIYPESMWDIVGKRTGGVDIDMESLAFSDDYRIWSEDRKFAFDFCHTRMMEYLMQHPGLAVRIDGQLRTVRMPGLVPLDELSELAQRLVEICDLIPRFLRKDDAGRG